MPRPSGASVWVPCPGAPSLTAGLPTDESDIAREGTAAHWLAEQILIERVMDMCELIDRQASNGVFIDEKMTDFVQVYINLVCTVISNPVVERPIPIDDIAPGETGTPDAFGWHAHKSKRMVVADLKYGWRIVEPFENWQEICYSLALFRQYPTIEEFEFFIVQPRAPHLEGPVRSWVVSTEELARVYWPKVIASAKGGDCFTGPQCRDCDAALRCGALRQAAASASQYVASPVIESYDGSQLSIELSMLEAAEIYLDARIEAIRTMATDRAFKTSGSIPGWEIERAAGSKYWNDKTDLTDLETVTGLNLHKKVPLTPNQAVDAGLSLKIVGQYSDRSQGKVKLVKHNSQKMMKRMGKPSMPMKG